LGAALRSDGRLAEAHAQFAEALQGSFTLQTATGSRYGSQFVTAEKGYLLLFAVDSAEPASLNEIEKSFESIRFLESAN
jgi:hypothetical protein